MRLAHLNKSLKRVDMGGELNYENLLADINGFGRYQKAVMFSMCLFYIPVGMTLFSPVFLYTTPSHRCYVPSVDEQGLSLNRTQLAQYIPVIESEDNRRTNLTSQSFAQCKRYNTNLKNEVINSTAGNITVPDTEECLEGWVYMDAEEKNNVVVDFDLVCDSSWMKPILASGPIFGFTIASVAGALSDRYGRRRIFLISNALLGLTCVGCSFSPNYQIMLALIIILGVAMNSAFSAMYILLQELADSKRKAAVSPAVYGFHSIGNIILPLVAYLVIDWRWIFRGIGTTFLLQALIYYRLLPESPRWLLATGRRKEAVCLLETIARVNRTTKNLQAKLKKGDCLIEHEHNNNKNTKTEAHEQEGIISFFKVLAKNSTMRNRTLVVCLAWAASFECYYMFGYNTSNLDGSKYWNCFISGLVDIPCSIVLLVAVQKLGRRATTSLSFGLIGLFSMLSAISISTYGATVTFAMCGKFFATISLEICYLYTSELYPTPARSTVLGLAGLSSRVGSISAPFIIYAGENYSKTLPYYVVTGVSLILSILSLLLPETKSSPLPETNKDALDLEQKRLSVSCKKPAGEDDQNATNML